MKVIGSGFGRTGTLSMKYALEELGFDPCYHMQEVVKNPSHLKLWHDIVMGKPKNWDKIFTGFRATVDFPASIYYKELMEKYPDAKVVHTIRDPERWYNSTHETIYQVGFVFPTWVKTIIPPVRRFVGIAEMMWTLVFDDRFEDRDYAIQVFNEYTEEVKRTVPPERLLVFEVKQGWEPLCEFLGVPVPDTPFPHVNDREEMLNRMKKMRLVSRLAPLIAILVLMVVFILLNAVF